MKPTKGEKRFDISHIKCIMLHMKLALIPGLGR